MTLAPHVQKRFSDLSTQGKQIIGHCYEGPDHLLHVQASSWNPWIASALNLLSYLLGESSIHYRELARLRDENNRRQEFVHAAVGVFEAARLDIESGVVGSMEQRVSGELFAGFIVTAKAALSENQKDVAAVLACSALEDTLKKYAALNGIDVQGMTMAPVVGALKGAGLVSGVQKGLLDAMPRIRNAAMHADWEKITHPDVASVIAFTEQFLLSHLS